jgi:hypothetical protein
MGALPGAREWAERGAGKAFLQSTGSERAVLKNIAKEPGGHRARVEAMERMGIGKGIWPTPRKSAEQAELAAELKNAERQALVDAAGPDVRIPSTQNAQYMRQAASREYPAQVADKAVRDRINAEAAAQAQAGKQGYETVTGRRPVQPPVQPREYVPDPIEAEASFVTEPPAPGSKALPSGADNRPVIQGELEPPAGALPAPRGSAMARYSHTSPLVAGEEFAERVPTQRYRTLQQQQDEISAYNRRAFDAQKARAGEDASVNRTLGGAVNDSAEDTLNKISPGLGTAWRGNKIDTSVAIKAHDAAIETAGKPMIMRSAGRGIARAATMFGTSTGNIPVAAAGVMADVAMTPQLQMHAYRGVGRVAQAAGRVQNTAIGRILAKMPGAQLGAQTVRSGAMTPEAEEGFEEVQRAAMESPDKGAQTHYTESETNPAYRAAANKVQD